MSGIEWLVALNSGDVNNASAEKLKKNSFQQHM
jgi:hypothetical protein